MRAYAASLKEKGAAIVYIEANEPAHDLRVLIPQLAAEGIEKLHIIDPTDDYASRRIQKQATDQDVEIIWYDNPLFLNTAEQNRSFFTPEKKKFYQSTFYKAQRIERKILIENTDQPIGGRWSFDSDNRKKYPQERTPPAVKLPRRSTHYTEAIAYVKAHFPDAPGEVGASPLYPVDSAQAQTWLRHFLEARFYAFGDYEDAIVPHESLLHHSLLSPLINVGLLHPQKVLDTLLSYAQLMPFR